MSASDGARAVLWGHRDSGHAVKVALALHLAGIDHGVEVVDIWAAPETRPDLFRARSPLGQVPLLELDGVALTQSGAILMEIADRFATLGGESASGLRRGRTILMWEANRIGMCVPQLIEARRPGGDAFPDGAVAWLAGRYAADAAQFETLLGAGPFLHGEAPGIGDCAVWGYARWIDRAGLTAPPALAAWLDRMAALPATERAAAAFG
ncbi:Disulfide-bond oxidoreductase YfcG [Roseivivax jejudonensis]|uniref:Disulfide-bond oxidoreductase YfcG n=1 Tax=Roseivivax jejudonensis TaxID=1529041 RepID=A0A1X7A2J5_9RHOB|nr:glutathione S-transferase family protein [Roseivivax jejudonensis]SLN68463.1 Disulfide-bond oxidoreductase YfcG [Roseivivax jejudonensis]